MSRLLIFIFLFLHIQSLAQEQEPKTVKAKKGEGIHALLRRYDMDSAYYYHQFLEINKEKLGENKWLIQGNTYALPEKLYDSTKKEVSYPIKQSNALFGEKYREFEIVDNQLKDCIFYIIAGHGGPDPGAIGKRFGKNLCEDEYAYDVSLRLYRNLLSHGATVYIIIKDPDDGIRDEDVLACDQDEQCFGDQKIPLNQLKRLKQRTKEINKISRHISNDVYERALIIHCDSRSKTKRLDVFFYHYSKSPKGKSLATNILKTFNEKYAHHQPNRGYKGTITSRDGLYMIKNTRPPAVYIELGNIQNDLDQIRFIKENNRQALANWLMQGIFLDYEEYLKSKK